MKPEIYNDLAIIVEETRKLETFLDKQGGEGKGLWEKSDNLKEKLPSGITDRILCVALARNKAMHGSAQIDDIDLILNEIKFIQILLPLNKDIDKIINSLAGVDRKSIQQGGMFDRILIWISQVKAIQADQKKYTLESLLPLYNEHKEILDEAESLVKKYSLKKALFFNTLFIAIVTFLAFVVWRYF